MLVKISETFEDERIVGATMWSWGLLLGGCVDHSLVLPGSSVRVDSHRLFVDSILFLSQISPGLDPKSSNRPLLRVLNKHKFPDTDT